LAVLDTLGEPVDGASLGAFRVGFGVLMALGAVRFVGLGWVEELYVAPGVWFPFIEGFGPFPKPWVYLPFGLWFLGALGIAWGRPLRPAVVVFLAGFGTVELWDKVNYLNHYVLVTLLAALLLVVPADRALVVGQPEASVPFWAVALLRLQVGVVYFFAGVAKIGWDWLILAQPMRIWMESRSELPLVGPWLAFEPTAWVLCWGGLIFDLTVPFFLAWPRTRAAAFVVLVGFHGIVGTLFPIGLFSPLMILSTTLFFDPSWPRRFMGGGSPAGAASKVPWGPLVAWALVQVLVPLRFLAVPGDVLWHEQGFRFSWRVLVVEEAGDVTLRVAHTDGKIDEIPLAKVLPYRTWKSVVVQPDLIRDYARQIARGRDVEVRAEAWLAQNGRPPARFIDPEVDLARVSDGWFEARRWVLPSPREISP
jgi:vitamin K-dependent gamma-carboxylase